MSKQAELQSIIDNLRNAIPELRGAIIASSDGLAIAQSLSSGDPNRVAAMAATALGLGKRITDTLGAGTLSETTVSGNEGQIFLYSAGTKGVLALIAKSGANVGLINLEARDAAQSITLLL
ncbi:MAG: roadblock/LC7 domain-containing protein [Trueperaceae bacterium]|nr:roadblock/LC7 domain-containing protein [Trueperaceae bacterium]